MVKLLEVYASNFKKPVFDKELRMPEGVTLICGPNESGKSTILDIILYAFYSRVIRPSARPSDEDLITYRKRHAKVRVRFLSGNRELRVERDLYLKKPNTARLWIKKPDGKWEVVATGQRQVTEQVKRYLGGVSFHEMVASNVVAQKDLEHLVEQGREDRIKVVNAFMNLDCFNTALKDLNEERRNLEGTHSRPGKLTLERQKLEELQRRLEEYREKEREFKKLEKSVQWLENEVKRIGAELEEITKLYTSLEAYKRARDRRRQLSQNIDAQKKLLRELESRLRELKTVEKRLEETQRELAGFSDLESAERLLMEVEEMKGQASRLTIRKEEVGKRVEEVRWAMAQLERELSGFDKKKIEGIKRRRLLTWPLLIGAVICFLAAFVMLSMNLPQFMAVGVVLVGILLIVSMAYQISMETKARLLISKVQSLEDHQKTLQSLTGEIEALESDLSKLTANALERCRSIRRYAESMEGRRWENLEEAASQLSRLLGSDKEKVNSLEERMRNLKSQLKEKPSLEEKRERCLKELEELEKEAEGIVFPELPEGVVFSDEVYEKTKKRREDLENDLNYNKGFLNGQRKRLKKASDFLVNNQEVPDKERTQREVVEKLERRVQVVKIAIEALEKTAESLRERVRPNVERYMSRILPSITNGRYRAVQLDEDYNLKVWDPDAGEFRAKEVFSGGTEDQFLLAMRLAFALALMPESKGTSPEFLFLDEPLASSDADRREGIIRFIKEDLSAKFKQIFIISHISDLESEVDHVIRLEDGRILQY